MQTNVYISCRIDVHYGDSLCFFGGNVVPDSYISVMLDPGEMITDTIAFYDAHHIYTQYDIIVSFKFNTTFGHSYGTFGAETAFEMKFHGKNVLYFYGKAFGYIDAIGVQYGEC